MLHTCILTVYLEDLCSFEFEFFFKLFKSVFKLMTTKPLPWSAFKNPFLDGEYLCTDSTYTYIHILQTTNPNARKQT